MSLAVFVADIGSVTRGNFGWASHPEYKDVDHTSIRAMGDAIFETAKGGFRIALGVECPLFIPCPEDGTQLGKARTGEGTLAWSAQIGATAAILGLQELCWVLRYARAKLPGDPKATLDWDDFETGSHVLFLWEAFISGKAK